MDAVKKSYFDDYFDMTYVINLKNRTDRYEHMINFFKILNIKKYKFIDPKEVNPDLTSHDSCRESHFFIYDDAVENNYDRIMIFEDDATFNYHIRNMNERLIDLLDKSFNFLENNDDWDLFYFDNIKKAARRGNVMVDYIRFKFDRDRDIEKITGKHFTHSYAINIKNVKDSIEDFKDECFWEFFRPIDWILNKTKLFSRKYMLKEGLFDQLIYNNSDTKWYIEF